MKRKILRSDLLLWIGILLCSCPLLIGYCSQKKTQSILLTYEEIVEQTAEEEIDALWKQAENYNIRLWETSGGIGGQQQTQEQEEYWTLLNPQEKKNGIMGVLNIPSIDVRLPVYHGTDEEILKEGAGHLIGSSVPIGGKNTHSVLTGHRGLASARLFTRLDELTTGDEFFLEILGKKLVYQVEEIRVIRPDEVEYLEIRSGEDLVSLVTCTPYGINTHRLVVTGKRMSDTKHEEEKEKRKLPSVREIIFSVIPFLFLIYVLIDKIRRKRGKRNCEGKKRRGRNRYYRKRRKKQKKSADSSAAFVPDGRKRGSGMGSNRNW